ncbi:hypothetical protein ACFQX7_06240 [Luedemannella flava]
MNTASRRSCGSRRCRAYQARRRPPASARAPRRAAGRGPAHRHQPVARRGHGGRSAQQAHPVERGDAVGDLQQRAVVGGVGQVGQVEADVVEQGALDDGDRGAGVQRGQRGPFGEGGDGGGARGGEDGAARPASRAAVPADGGVVEQEHVGGRLAQTADDRAGGALGEQRVRVDEPHVPAGRVGPVGAGQARRDRLLGATHRGVRRVVPGAPTDATCRGRGPGLAGGVAAQSGGVLDEGSSGGGVGGPVDQDELDVPAGLVEDAVQAGTQVRRGAGHGDEYAEFRYNSGICHMT